MFYCRNLAGVQQKVQVVKGGQEYNVSAGLKVRKKAKITNRYNQAQNLTQDTTWESIKNTIKHNTQEILEVSPFPAGDHKATTNRQENMTNTKHKKQKWSTKEHRLVTVSKTSLLEGLN